MAKKFNIEKLIKNISDSQNDPVEVIFNYFEKKYKRKPTLEFILETIFEKKYSEVYCGMLIDYLISDRINVSSLSRQYIINAIKAGYSERIIMKLLEIPVKYKLNLNEFFNENYYICNIMFTLIYEEKYKGNITPIYKFLLKNGFVNGLNNDDDETLIEAIENAEIEGYCSISAEDKEEFIKEYNKFQKDSNYLIKNDLDYTIKGKKTGKIYHDEKDEFLEKFGEFIKNEVYAKNYSSDKKYYDNMYNSMNNDGKFTLVEGKDEGVNLITEFGLLLLSNSNYKNINRKRILKTSYNKLINNCTSIGALVENIILLMRICAEYNIILYIEDFIKIYRSINPFDYGYLKKEYLNTMIEFLVEKKGLTLVATLKKGDSIYFKNSYTCSCANLITTNEAIKDLLLKYIENKLNYKNINFIDNCAEKLFIDLVLTVVNENNRNNSNEVSNIILVDNIINNLYNILSQDESYYVTIFHIKETINYLDYINELGRKEINNLLDESNVMSNSVKKKIKKVGV